MLVQTLVDALRGRAVSHGSAPALWRKQGDSPYRPWTWSECAQSASRIARGLLSLNLPPMSTLAMLCGHRPEWLPLELGAMGAGLVAAPLYPTWPTDLLVAVLRRIGAAAVVVESPAQLAILKEARAGLPQLALGIALEGPVEGERWVHSLAEVMARGDGQSSSDWTELGQGLDPNAVALCAVTPGTVDAPRLVRHSHAALVAHARRFSKAVGLGEQDSVLARRTPALALERAVLHAAVVAGAQVFVAGAQGSFAAHLKEARPTFVHGVPAEWEALRRAVEERLAGEPPNRQKVLIWARRAALEGQRLQDDALPVPGATLAKLQLARALLFQPLKLSLGLQAARTLLTGLAPVRRETLELFTSLDLPLSEAWGLCEAGGPVAVNARGSRRLGTQGRPLPGVAVRIASDAEILLHTDTCHLSGDGDEAPLIDRGGWLHTGDVGELDSDGFLRVQGRKDESLSLRGRRRTSARVVEARLCSVPLVAHAVAVADGRAPVALLSLDRERSARYAREQGLPDDPAQLARHPALLAQLERDLAAVQRDAPETERVVRFAVVPGGFLAERGELTPAGTIRRKVIARRRAGLLELLLGRKASAKKSAKG